jgi:hypothetical protein
MRKTQPETSTSDDGRWIQRITASQPDPEMVYWERETFEFINAVLGKMKPAPRQALTMTYYDALVAPVGRRPLLHSLPIEVLFSTLLQDPRIDRPWKPRIHDGAPAIPGDG